MTHILIPREPSAALLRPFIGCNTQELHEAWAAMVRIAEVQHARDGRQCLAHIEEPARKVHATAPERPYLQGGPQLPAETEFGALSDVTWCRYDVDGTGIPYMRADLAGAAPAAVVLWPQGKYPPLPKVGPIGYASVVDVQSYAKSMSIDSHLPGVRDVALWTTDQLRAYFDLGRQEAPALEAPADFAKHLAEGRANVERSANALAAAPQAPAAPSGLPHGWVPCILTHDGQHPEEVAYGPQIMMDRLKKWLGRYFELLSQAAPAAPAVDAGDTALLDAMERHRIALVPENEGPWDAELYEEGEEPQHIGSGATPREALRAAIAAQAAAKGADDHG